MDSNQIPKNFTSFSHVGRVRLIRYLIDELSLVHPFDIVKHGVQHFQLIFFHLLLLKGINDQSTVKLFEYFTYGRLKHGVNKDTMLFTKLVLLESQTLFKKYAAIIK